MHETAARLKKHHQSQLDLALGLCRAGFDCCGKVAEINTTTVRKLLTQAGGDLDSLIRGDAAGFLAASGKLAEAHWASALACGLEFQRQLLSSFAPK